MEQRALSHQDQVISVISLPLSGLKGVYKYYRIQVSPAAGTQSRTFMLSYNLSLRLWRRFLSSSRRSTSVTKLPYHHNSTADCEERVSCAMPGEGCGAFFKALYDALYRKLGRLDLRRCWVVPSSLYKLWLFTSHVSTELFADCLNESGVLSTYCSLDTADVEFSSLGPWEDHENVIQGGAGNPPFDTDFISRIVRCFQLGVQRPEPYCRLVLLPLGEKYDSSTRVNTLTFEGELLLTAPPGCFPFLNEQVLSCRGNICPKPSNYQSVGIFVWCNREYLVQNKPPRDVEELYEVWSDNFLYNTKEVMLHRDAFLRAFPPELRSAESMLDFYVQEVLHGN